MDQYNNAIEYFDAVLKLEPNHLQAINNKALCYLYSCKLSEAIKLLEDTIKSSPEKNVSDAIVFNLCSLYDSKSESSEDQKKSIRTIVWKHAPDNFDLSVLKLKDL